MDACRSRLGLQHSRGRSMTVAIFIVGGERILPEATAAKLVLEDGDIIDVAVKELAWSGSAWVESVA